MERPRRGGHRNARVGGPVVEEPAVPEEDESFEEADIFHLSFPFIGPLGAEEIAERMLWRGMAMKKPRVSLPDNRGFSKYAGNRGESRMQKQQPRQSTIVT